MPVDLEELFCEQPANLKTHPQQALEDKVRKAEERYYQLLELSPDAIFIQCEGKIICINAAGLKLFGAADPEQLVGRNALDLWHPDCREIVKERIRQLIEEGTAFPRLKEKLLRLDGASVDVEVAAGPFTYHDKPAIHVIARDITKHEQAMAQLYRAELLYRTLLEQSPDGVVLVDPETALPIEFNDAACRQLGLSREEFSQLRLSDFEAQETTERTQVHIDKIMRQGKDTFETLHRTKQGEIRNILVTAHRIDLAERPIFHCIFHDSTEGKRAEKALEESQAAIRRSHEQLRALTARLLTAQEEERRRLSRDLHDDLNQKLVLLVVEMEALERKLPDPASWIGDQLRSLRNRMIALSDDVRGLAHQLHPSILDDLGLVIALKSYTKEFAQRTKIRTQFMHRNLPELLPREISSCFYRVVQESLGNIAKYARTQRIVVTLTGTANGITLSIKDFGIGFDPEILTKHGRGLGIISMQERVRLVNGQFSLKSGPGQGTQIIARVPLPERLT